MKRWMIAAASIAIGLLPARAAIFAAAGGQNVPTYAGDAEFKVYCSSCHGNEAKGDGPIAKSLKKRPADLTQLALHNAGVFPADRVVKIVDGRTPVEGHGKSDMPAWGEAFAQSVDSKTPEAVTARIAAVVEYLKSIQAK